MASALLLATAEAAEGGPAALLDTEGTTLLERLLGQLADLGVAPVQVLTRPAWESAVRASAGPGVPVDASADVSEDLERIAALARDAGEPLLVAAAEILVHRHALAALLTDPRIATGALVTESPWRGRAAFRLRSDGEQIISATSAYHRVLHPTGMFLEVVKLHPGDREAAARAAGELARLVGPGALPEGWEAELERKAGLWRERAGRKALHQATAEPHEDDCDQDEEEAGELDPLSEDEAAVRTRAAREDAAALLLVGLVRSGVGVGQRRTRGLFWRRPLSADAVRGAEAELARVDEEKIALDAAVKAKDGFFTTFFVSPYSRYIARFAARVGLTPNVVTTFSMAIGALAAGAFALGSRGGMVAGALLLQAAFTFDCVDGQLARYTHNFSNVGAWLDSVFDRGKEYLVYAGLAAGAAHGFDQNVWVLAGAALTLQTTRHAIDFAFATTRHATRTVTRRLPLDAVIPPRRPRRPAARSAPSAPAPTGAVATVAPPRPRTAKPAARARARRAVSLIGRLDDLPGAVWLKRMIVLPIGERFALISLTAAIWSPKVTFIALLVWGAVAAAYAVPGRILRSVAR
ncbi:MAG TPA: CDP-alcohol phosphatidyltransferase family protein [Solirubrobacter sp.]|nr:CDP-alcohol phosphatidyltransferase family protein [Solirubrobacter sp.]